MLFGILFTALFNTHAFAENVAVKTTDGKTVKVSSDEIIRAATKLNLIKKDVIVTYSAVRIIPTQGAFERDGEVVIFSNIKVLAADNHFYPMLAEAGGMKLICQALGFSEAATSGGFTPEENSQIKYITFLGGDVRIYKEEQDSKVLTSLGCYRYK